MKCYVIHVSLKRLGGKRVFYFKTFFDLKWCGVDFSKIYFRLKALVGSNAALVTKTRFGCRDHAPPLLNCFTKSIFACVRQIIRCISRLQKNVFTAGLVIERPFFDLKKVVRRVAFTLFLLEI